MVGDSFAESSLRQQFLSLTENNSFTRANFDVKCVLSKQFGNANRSMVSRIRNNIVMAINDFTVLPKILVIITESDFINATKEVAMDELEKVFNRELNWLMNEIRKIFMTYDEYLPKKSKRTVNVLWTLPTVHVYHTEDEANRREVLIKCMTNITKLHPHNRALELKQLWDPEDTSLYLAEPARMTGYGLTMYWKALDRTIRFFDFIINKHEEKKNQQSNVQLDRQDRDRGLNRAPAPAGNSFTRREFETYKSRGHRPRQGTTSSSQDLRRKLPQISTKRRFFHN